MCACTSTMSATSYADDGNVGDDDDDDVARYFTYPLLNITFLLAAKQTRICPRSVVRQCSALERASCNVTYSFCVWLQSICLFTFVSKNYKKEFQMNKARNLLYMHLVNSKRRKRKREKVKWIWGIAKPKEQWKYLI